MTAAVALTFDDLFVDNWLAARPIFDAYGARVTFCVCKLHKATEAQVAGLRTLQADGHEIAYHTRTHPRLIEYLEKHGLDRWLEDEIDRGIAEHRAMGFPARSFASPFHRSTPKSRAATAERFAVTRSLGPASARKRNLRNRIYGDLGPDKTVDCIGFCDFALPAFRGWDWQMALLDIIAEEGGTGVFCGHDIRSKPGRSKFCSTPEDMHRFLAAVTERGLGFKTLSEVGA